MNNCGLIRSTIFIIVGDVCACSDTHLRNVVENISEDHP